MKEITAKEVEDLMKEGKVLNIIDVREIEEVAAGVIPSTKSIPLNLVESRMHELDKSKEYILVCHSGGRSGIATQFLESKGYNVTNMRDGMVAWQGKVELLS